MRQEIKILFLEDTDTDVELSLRELRSAGLNVVSKVAQTETDFIKTLRDFKPEIILADYSLPSYNGMDALEYIVAHRIKTPFIFVSGTMGEEVAVEAVKHGATDYVLKNHLLRLGPMVKRALKETIDRKKREEAELSLQRSEANFRSIFQTAADLILTVNNTGFVLDCNTRSKEFLGFESEEIIGQAFESVIHPDFRDKVMDSLDKVFATGYTFKIEFKMIGKDGSVIDVCMHSSLLKDKEVDRCICIIDNITERKQAEEALVESEIRYRRLFESATDGILILDADTGMIIAANPILVKMLGFSREQLLGKTIWELGTFKDIVADRHDFTELRQKEYIRCEELQLETDDGRSIDVEFVGNGYTVNNKRVIQCNVRDITERRRTERLVESQCNLLDAVINSPGNMYIYSLDTRYCYTTFNKKYKEEMKRAWDADIEIGMNLFECIGNLESRAAAKLSIDRALQGEIFSEMQHQPEPETFYELDWSPVYQNSIVIGVTVFIRDITERKRAENQERLAYHVLDLLNRPHGATDMVRDILLLVKENTNIEAVGIRLREGDDFPYNQTNGFPEDFVQAERYLCAYDEAGRIVRDGVGNPVLECMCGNVLCGRTDARLPFFTGIGSFWTNSTTKLLASATEEDRKARTRDRCNGEGYESVALIPLWSGREIIGLLQLNDRRPNRFTLEMIRFFEGLGASIGIALLRKQAEDQIRSQLEELRRWQNVMLDREDRVLDLKHEVNELLGKAGLQPRYPSAESHDKKEK